MSVEAKLLYGCLLDRNSLSQKNGWVDEQNRVYVLYSIENMKRDLGCASEKVNKVLKELERISPQRESKFMQIDSSCKSSETSI